MTDLATQARTRATQLAPWRSALPWWVVLVEGVIFGGMGLLVVIDPTGTTNNLAFFFTILLIVVGLVQTWSVIRSRVPETMSGPISARAGIGIYAGLSIMILLFMDVLTLDVGRVLFGLAASIFGLLGVLLIVRGATQFLRGLIIDTVFFLVVGLLMLYVQWWGSGAFVVSATRVVGWLALITGIGLIGFAFWRSQNAPPEGATADGAADEQGASDGTDDSATAAAMAEDTPAVPPASVPEANTPPPSEPPQAKPPQSEPPKPSTPPQE